MGENHLDAVPIAIYGGVLLMSAIAFRILEVTLIRTHKKEAVIFQTVSRGNKEKISIIAYLIGIALSFVQVAIPIICYVFVALMWIIPSRKMEKAVSGKS